MIGDLVVGVAGGVLSYGNLPKKAIHKIDKNVKCSKKKEK